MDCGLDVAVFHYLASKFGYEKVAKTLGRDPSGAAPVSAAATKKVDEEDDFDLFGDQTEEEKAALAKKQETVASEKKQKKKVIDKSTLVIDIKPNNVDTDLQAVEKAVRSIVIEGVTWNQASKILPIAFGLNKLQMGAVIIDDLVATDDIIEQIEKIGMTPEEAEKYNARRETGDENEEEEDEEEEAPGWVQSAEIVSFQKL